MEKIKIGVQMARHWSDPTMVLILIVPYGLSLVFSTLWFAFDAYRSLPPALPGSIEHPFFLKLALVPLPYLFTVFWWKVLYHGLFEDPSVDTSQFVIFRDASLAKYYKHRRIPMCELVELYINEHCDWNEECEEGDCYKILQFHRDEFVNYKTSWRQVRWLCEQFLPTWLTGAGLGKGSSSGKSVEETTKEISEHYDKGNDVFSCILGKAMVYTCGIWHKVPQFASSGWRGDYAASAADGTLEEAQYNKMQMICDKLQLQKGETFLDIGCGWGTLARHAASENGAIASGVTLSREGKIYCDMASERTGVPTTIYHCDYRDIPKNMKFDKIASIEMAEHVGIKNFVDPYLKGVRNLMSSKDSLFLMQVAGLRQGSNWQDVAWGLFMSKFVFPGADASTPLNWYIRQCELAGFEVHSVETIGRHYSHTLHKWYDNWMSHKEDILSGKIDAISDHTKGKHLFRLNEFTWAWCTIAAGQSSATCYQILMHPNEYDYPRDRWVDPSQVSGPGLTGVGLSKAAGAAPKSPAAKPRGRPPKSPKPAAVTPKGSAKKAKSPKGSATRRKVTSTKKTRA